MNQAVERRKFPRFRIKLKANVKAKALNKASTHHFTTENISAGGVFITGDSDDCPFDDMALLNVNLFLESDTSVVWFLGKVAHQAEGGKAFGIKIAQIESAEQDKLNDFIKQYADQNPDAIIEGSPTDS